MVTDAFTNNEINMKLRIIVLTAIIIANMHAIIIANMHASHGSHAMLAIIITVRTMILNFMFISLFVNASVTINLFYIFLLYFQYWKWSMVTKTFTNKHYIKNHSPKSPNYNFQHKTSLLYVAPLILLIACMLFYSIIHSDVWKIPI